MQKNVVIAGYARSPFHFAHKGALTKVRPDDLAAAGDRGADRATRQSSRRTSRT